MIFGIGTDIVHINRMKDSLDKHGDKFARRILTDHEFAEFEKLEGENIKPAFLAKRFAAKEATAKAMGTGFTQGLSLHHIGVKHDDAGRPILDFVGIADEFMRQNKILHPHLSLADEREYAVAFVTLAL